MCYKDTTLCRVLFVWKPCVSDILLQKQEGNGNSMENEDKRNRTENDVNEADNKKNNSSDDRAEKRETEKHRDEKISEYGQTVLNNDEPGKRIHLLSIIGEIEGHECSNQNMKTTKYEHVLPQLAQIEDDKNIGIHTTQDNLAARSLYTSAGYTVTEIGPCTTGDGVERVGYTFQKEL